MKAPWANISLLIILITLAVTGYLGLVNGYEAAAWRLWIHGIAAYALVVLFIWKSTIIFDAYRRKKTWTRQRLSFSVMLLLLLTVVIMGLLWTFNGPRHVGGFSLVSLHIYLAIPVMLILVIHVRRMKFIFKVKGAGDRRLFLGTAVSALAGLFLWRGTDLGKEAVGLAGAQRRFTGSYEQASFTGRFPSVSWIFDYPDPIDLSTWRLKIDGAVRREILLSYEELLGMTAVSQEVLLDCTSGWYTTQLWQGVRLTDLLAKAGLQASSASITVAAVSTYKRRFPLDKLDEMFLAYQVANAPLAHGNGAPMRLVCPNLRGYDWVKWVNHIQVNSTSAIWQSPLPLS